MPNRLINESSPYLLQHANNPVDWFPYGEEAFAVARSGNKPLLISIGYSACHWCHVMEHESFSNPSIADLMNRYFVCVKVDREERPDVDQMYMAAVQLLHGNGGWPLNCFALPDGRPFWGGTYFRPQQWSDLLEQIHGFFQNSFADLESQAQRLCRGIAGAGLVEMPQETSPFSPDLLKSVYDRLSVSFDTETGGMVGAPKFPMPVVWQFVLHYHRLSHLPEAIHQVKTTLLRMAMGGIFDQIGGGFARYSTDALWKVPHFEKMLYDNAQLTSLYANAYKATGDKSFLDIAGRIIHFVLRELTAEQGAFYASVDADSEGVEGLFYLWNRKQMEEVLPEYAGLIADYWGIDNEGKWENGMSIPLRPLSDAVFASRQHLSEEELRQLVLMSSSALLKVRNQRQRPATDTKILTSWNAMMVKGLVDAVKAGANPIWQEAAVKAGEFIFEKLALNGQKLFRSYNHGSPAIDGFLDDYAFTADAFIALYQITFDEKWLFRAGQLVEQAEALFSDNSLPLYWFSGEGLNNAEAPVVRMMETTDGVEPSANAVMAGVLLALAHYFDNQAFHDKAVRMMVNMQERMLQQPSAYACWASQAAVLASGNTSLVISGPDALKNALLINRRYYPGVIIAAAENQSALPVFSGRFKSGQNLIFKCRNNTCEAPVSSVVDLIM